MPTYSKYALDDLKDVNAASPSTDDLIAWDGTSYVLVAPASLSGVAKYTDNIDVFADVNYTSPPTDGQFLIWDNASGYWEPGDLPFGTPLEAANNLSDLTNAATGRTNLGLGDSATRDVGIGSGDVAAGDHGHWQHEWIAAARQDWLTSGMSNWSSATTGTGSTYLANPRFFNWLNSSANDPQVISGATCETGNGTTGTNAAVRYSDTRTWLADGRTLAIEIALPNGTSEIQEMRIGFWGNDSTPATTGRPSDGVWLEFDRSVSTTNWYLATGSASTYSTSDTGTATVNSVARFFLHFDSGGAGAEVYPLSVGGTPLPPMTSINTNLPSGDMPQTCRLFWQIEKLTSGPSSARGHLQVGYLTVLADRIGDPP